MTTYKELYGRVLLRLPTSDGRSALAVREAVNTAQKIVARVQDFDELIVLDTTNAATVDGTASYHIVDDWGLTRPKDLLTLRLMSTTESRKLRYVPVREVDEIYPYVIQLEENKSLYYTRRGKNVELIPIPDAAYDIYITYAQWPLPLSADADVCQYDDIDDVLITLAAGIAKTILSNETGSIRELDFEPLAKMLLQGAVIEEISRPDNFYVAKPFNPYTKPPIGEYWKDPFIKKVP